MAVMALLERSALLHLFIVSLVVLPSHCFVICNTGKTALAHSSYRSRGPQDNRPSVKHVNRALVQSLTPTRRAERARRPLVRAGAWMGVSAVDVEKGGVRQGANQGTAVPWRTCRRRRSGCLFAEREASVSVEYDQAAYEDGDDGVEVVQEGEEYHGYSEYEGEDAEYEDEEDDEEEYEDEDDGTDDDSIEVYAGAEEEMEVSEKKELRYASYYEWDGKPDEDGGDPLYYLKKLEKHLAGIEDTSKPSPIRGEWETTSFSYGDDFEYSNFSQSSFHVDLCIEMGNVDEKKRERIQPALKVLGNIADLIDTTDDVFSFKYFGRIRNRAGIEAWAKQMITECFPNTKDVKMVTNRTRDLRDN